MEVMNAIQPAIRRGWAFIEWLMQKIFRRSFVRNVGVLTLAKSITLILSFVQGILIARWLGPELYGIAALIMGFPNSVYTFFDARSSEASIRYLSEFHVRGERERALAMCKLGYAVDLGIAILAFVVVLAMAQWAASRIVQRPETTTLIIIYSAAFLPRALMGTSYAMLIALERFSWIASLEILTGGLRTVLVLGLVVASWQVTGVIWGNAIAMSIMGLLYGIVAYMSCRKAWQASWLSSNWKALRGYFRPIFRFVAYSDLSLLIGMVPQQLDVVLLGYFREPTEVGYYKLTKSIVTTGISPLIAPLQSVLYPRLAKTWALRDGKALRKDIRQVATYVGIPLGGAIILAALLMPFIIPALAGDTYRPAIIATQILLVGYSIRLTFFWLRPLYFALDRVREWNWGIFIYSSLFLIICFLVVKSWGYKGMALSSTLSLVPMYLLMLIVIYKTLKGLNSQPLAKHHDA